MLVALFAERTVHVRRLADEVQLVRGTSKGPRHCR